MKIVFNRKKVPYPEFDPCIRDITVGKEYTITALVPKGKQDFSGVSAFHNTLEFTDDVGDTVALWPHEYDITITEGTEDEIRFCTN